jgi:hypothetical protein
MLSTDTKPKRALCYTSYAASPILDQLFQYTVTHGGWAHIPPIGLELYIPEDRAFWLLLIDPEVLRKPHKDYIL